MDEQQQLHRSASFSLTRLAAATATTPSPSSHETLITISTQSQNVNPFLESVASEITGRRSSYNGPGKVALTSSDDESEDEEEEEYEGYDNSNNNNNNVDDGSRSGRVVQNNSKKQDKSTVLRSTSNNANFERGGSYHGGSKMRSRLMDPLPERKSGLISTTGMKSGMINTTGMKSGMINANSSSILRSNIFSSKITGGLGQYQDRDNEYEEEEEDEEDNPEEYYKKEPISVIVALEWATLVLLLTTLICSLTIPVLKQKVVLNLSLWKWEVLILVVISGRLVSGWVIKFIVLLLTRSFILRKRLLYFIYGLKKPVRNCVWLGLALLTWQFLFDKRVEREANIEILHYVTRVLDCSLVGSVIWLVKTFVVKVLGSSFHVSAFFDRIQESLFNQFVIQTLSGPPVLEIRRSMLQDVKMAAEAQRFQRARSSLMSGRVIRESPLRERSGMLYSGGDGRGISVDYLQKLNQKNVSAWNMKKLMRIIRLGALDSYCNNSNNEDGCNEEIRTEVEAKAVAKKIFQNVTSRRRYIYFQDLLRFMEVDEAVKTLTLFPGGSENERISKSALKNWVVNAFRERRALSLTLNDTKTAVNKLHKMVKVVVGLIIVLIWLVILDIATTNFLLFLSSQVVLVAFVFGNFCKNVFESIIFLFVVHPYDVGDRCEIDGVQMVVEEMNILTTVFLRHDNQKITYPNCVLSTKAIHNYYRSPDMGDSVEFCFHILTPQDKITQVRQRILSYIENKKEHWYPNPQAVLKDFEGLDKIRIAVWLQHRMNHHDMRERWARRALLIEECVSIFQDLDIEYRCLPWNVNAMMIRSLTPLAENYRPSTEAEGNGDVVHR